MEGRNREVPLYLVWRNTDIKFVFFSRQFIISHVVTVVTTSLQVTPAMSREDNMECYVEGFYDYHDVWHFFSACGMFFAFLVSM